MHFKNIQIILAFITFALLVLSSPVNYDDNTSLTNDVNIKNDIDEVVNDDDETVVVTASLESEDDSNSETEIEIETLSPEQPELPELLELPEQPEQPK